MATDTPSSAPESAAFGASGEITSSTAYRVTLPEFEGPLDLLLHLCQTHELDILNISISFIAQKYIEYLELMEGMSVEIAAEYLVMAAHLAYLKSRELVPAPEPIEATEEGEEPLDPREELIRRLLEYQKYKHAAENLGNRPIEGRNIFVRGVPREDAGDPGLAEHSIWKLIEYWAGMLKEAKPELTHNVVMDRVSISDRINHIVDMLEAGQGMLRFEDILGKDLPEPELRHKIVVSLLAVLELAKMKVIRVMRDEATNTFFLAHVTGAELEGARKLKITSVKGEEKDEEDEPSPDDPLAKLAGPAEELLLTGDDEAVTAMADELEAELNAELDAEMAEDAAQDAAQAAAQAAEGEVIPSEGEAAIPAAESVSAEAESAPPEAVSPEDAATEAGATMAAVETPIVEPAMESAPAEEATYVAPDAVFDTETLPDSAAEETQAEATSPVEEDIVPGSVSPLAPMTSATEVFHSTQPSDHAPATVAREQIEEPVDLEIPLDVAMPAVLSEELEAEVAASYSSEPATAEELSSIAHELEELQAELPPEEPAEEQAEAPGEEPSEAAEPALETAVHAAEETYDVAGEDVVASATSPNLADDAESSRTDGSPLNEPAQQAADVETPEEKEPSA